MVVLVALYNSVFLVATKRLYEGASVGPSVIGALCGGESGGTGRTIQFSVLVATKRLYMRECPSVCRIKTIFFLPTRVTYAVYTALLY